MSDYSRQEFIQDWLSVYKDADKQVLGFIYDFLMHSGEDACETIRNQFRNGYCYYFAHMLQTAFHRGTVCVAAPLGHFVWMDINGVPYDIEGVNESECEVYIPENFMGNMVKDFLHIQGVSYNATTADIKDLIMRYKQSLT